MSDSDETCGDKPEDKDDNEDDSNSPSILTNWSKKRIFNEKADLSTSTKQNGVCELQKKPLERGDERVNAASQSPELSQEFPLLPSELKRKLESDLKDTEAAKPKKVLRTEIEKHSDSVTAISQETRAVKETCKTETLLETLEKSLNEVEGSRSEIQQNIFVNWKKQLVTIQQNLAEANKINQDERKRAVSSVESAHNLSKEQQEVILSLANKQRHVLGLFNKYKSLVLKVKKLKEQQQQQQLLVSESQETVEGPESGSTTQSSLMTQQLAGGVSSQSTPSGTQSQGASQTCGVSGQPQIIVVDNKSLLQKQISKISNPQPKKVVVINLTEELQRSGNTAPEVVSATGGMVQHTNIAGLPITLKHVGNSQVIQPQTNIQLRINYPQVRYQPTEQSLLSATQPGQRSISKGQGNNSLVNLDTIGKHVAISQPLQPRYTRQPLNTQVVATNRQAMYGICSAGVIKTPRMPTTQSTNPLIVSGPKSSTLGQPRQATQPAYGKPASQSQKLVRPATTEFTRSSQNASSSQDIPSLEALLKKGNITPGKNVLSTKFEVSYKQKPLLEYAFAQPDTSTQAVANANLPCIASRPDVKMINSTAALRVLLNHCCVIPVSKEELMPCQDINGMENDFWGNGPLSKLLLSELDF